MSRKFECPCGQGFRTKTEQHQHFTRNHTKPEPPPEPAPLPLDHSAPIPTWRRREPEALMAVVREYELDPYLAIAYEASHDNRPGLIAALQELIDNELLHVL